MLIIVTKFAGPTDHRGSRIIARSHSMRVTVPWNYALDSVAMHERAARQLAERAAERDRKEGYTVTDPQAPILSADLPGGDGARVHILGAART